MSDLLPKASSFSRRVECTLCGIGPDNAGIYKINGDVGTLALADIKSTNTIVRVDNRATYKLNGIELTPGTTDCFNIELNKAAVPEEDNDFDIEKMSFNVLTLSDGSAIVETLNYKDEMVEEIGAYETRGKGSHVSLIEKGSL